MTPYIVAALSFIILAGTVFTVSYIEEDRWEKWDVLVQLNTLRVLDVVAGVSFWVFVAALFFF